MQGRTREKDEELEIIRHIGLNYERYQLTGDEGKPTVDSVIQNRLIHTKKEKEKDKNRKKVDSSR